MLHLSLADSNDFQRHRDSMRKSCGPLQPFRMRSITSCFPSQNLLGAALIGGVNASVTVSSLGELLTEKLAAHPELIAVARENCARWLREGHRGAARLREWDALLAGAQTDASGFAKLREVLTGDDEQAARLRDFHPLAGILTREERRRARELCGYRH